MRAKCESGTGRIRGRECGKIRVVETRILREGWDADFDGCDEKGRFGLPDSYFGKSRV